MASDTNSQRSPVPAPAARLGKYMTAQALGLGPREVYLVRARNGAVLGGFEWYAPWRTYVFQPEHGAEFSPDCLRELAAFAEARTREVSP